MSEQFETVSLLVDAGEAKPGGSMAPALGPLGLNLGKVVADINSGNKLRPNQTRIQKEN